MMKECNYSYNTLRPGTSLRSPTDRTTLLTSGFRKHIIKCPGITHNMTLLKMQQKWLMHKQGRPLKLEVCQECRTATRCLGQANTGHGVRLNAPQWPRKIQCNAWIWIIPTSSIGRCNGILLNEARNF